MQTPKLADLIAPIERREAELVERIAAWSGINSGSRNRFGVARMAEVLCAWLETLTSEVSLVSLPLEEEIQDDGSLVFHTLGPAVRARCRPEAPVQILLNGHLDTVFGPEHPFQRVKRVGRHLVGPGVADMKGGLVVMIESLRILEAAPLRERIGWEVLLNPDEEIGSPGSAGMLREAAPRYDVGLIFEPALPDGSLVSSRPGIGNFLVRVHGRAAHAGREFIEGRSAVVVLAGLVGAFHKLNDDAGVIVNVGRISGGGPALNIVPSEAACRLNIRVDSPEKGEQMVRCIHQLVDEVGALEGFRAEVQGGIGRPPKPLTPTLEKLLGAFRDSGREIGLELGWAPTGGGSDGNILAAAGLPTVDSLGVRGGGIHTSEEFLEIDSITERIALCATFLLKVAWGDLHPWA